MGCVGDYDEGVVVDEGWCEVLGWGGEEIVLVVVWQVVFFVVVEFVDMCVQEFVCQCD